MSKFTSTSNIKNLTRSMKQQDELKEAIGRLIKIIDDNPCGMGAATFGALTMLVKEFIKFFVLNDISQQMSLQRLLSGVVLKQSN